MVKWSKPHFQEPAVGRLQDLTAHQTKRIAQLKATYPVAFEDGLRQSLALTNYLYLDLLDRVRQDFPWWTTPGMTIADVGSQHFYYAPVLHAFFQPQKLTGVEVEGYRMYQDGYSRIDYAKTYIHGLPNTHYQVMDFCEFDEAVDGITCFFPFLEPRSFVRWRLPLKVFRPELMVQTMARVLRPHGFVFMVNRGEKEGAIANTLLADTDLRLVGQRNYPDPLTDWNGPPVVGLWKKD